MAATKTEPERLLTEDGRRLMHDAIAYSHRYATPEQVRKGANTRKALAAYILDLEQRLASPSVVSGRSND